ncbi:MAG: GFA family protein [Pseudomonadota bacterium]|nr:GFA family protein [Pseudomonadota bacterium]
MTQMTGSCECGAASFKVSAKPLARAYCHCTICQEFNKADYADVSVFLSRDVTLEDPATVAMKSYKKTPPSVQRGKCRKCDKPALEYLDMPLLPGLTIIPSANIAATLPEPSMHIFYHRRKRDIQDDLPKHSGFLKSQWCFAKQLLPGIVRAY